MCGDCEPLAGPDDVGVSHAFRARKRIADKLFGLSRPARQKRRGDGLEQFGFSPKVPGGPKASGRLASAFVGQR